MNVSTLLRVAALVLFVLAAFSAFGKFGVDALGLVALGLAAWVGSTLP